MQTDSSPKSTGFFNDIKTTLREQSEFFQLFQRNSQIEIDTSPAEKPVFHLLLVKPTRYDDEGYAIHWYRSSLPSNSLACMNGIAQDCVRRSVLGEDIEIRICLVDETCDLIDYPALINTVKQAGQDLFLCLIGVQSNQYPRSVDIAAHFLAADFPVCIGGFHVSGCLSMLDELPPELIAAQEQGISLFAGEAEARRFDEVLTDARNRELKLLYNFQNDMVALDEQPLPKLPSELVRRNISAVSTLDLGRGCPYKCSFCCIINVQGQKSRSRSVEGLEKFLRHAAQEGIRQIFITDDNFARNKDWQSYFDCMKQLRAEGLQLHFIIQVDTLCHKIPSFIENAVAAGVDQVFIGLENINPDNLKAMQKHQNKLSEYREMILQWKRYPVIIWGAYIIGLPNDTRESIMKDIDIIKRELPIDLLNMSILTPLPGSEDHQRMLKNGEWMDDDLNKYDLTHSVIKHPHMPGDQLEQTYKDAWDYYYTYEHMKTILRRSMALGSNKRYMTVERLIAFGIITRLHNMRSYDMGFFRRKPRTSRRPGMALEPALLFYPKHYLGSAKKSLLLMFYGTRLARAMKRIWRDPETKNYRDTAITPPERAELDTLDLYQKTRGGVQVVKLIEHREKMRGKMRPKHA